MDEKNVTSPRKGGLSVYGTNVLMNISNTMGALPAFNSKVTSFGENGELISGEWVKEHILVNDPTCHACPVACKKEVEITSGPWLGLHMESLEYEPAWSMGANCGNNDANRAKMIDLCNDYGMDAIESGIRFLLTGSLRARLHQWGWPTGLGRRGRHGGMGTQDRLPRRPRQRHGGWRQRHRGLLRP
ncbi:aldehyde ferredoxin oxidoreductase C-terminal domain-containing protein [Candidatus Amarolinea dominans]|uniref:aldehyde ferredoxin oxidoreductase C-terminal domain-containing protein n=1 Tax=Candidatus Amarolinea dominans TaxID=3140696 RepID=UPI0031CCB45B